MYLMLVDDVQRRHYTMADIYSCAEQYITSYRPLLCLIAKKYSNVIPLLPMLSRECGVVLLFAIGLAVDC